MAKQRICGNCGEPGHRADHCPKAQPAGSCPTARDLVATLVEAAEHLGQTQALQAVEKAITEVQKREKAMRLALIRSRGENARLRKELEVAAVGVTFDDKV
jgi:hypothetical protein